MSQVLQMSPDVPLAVSPVGFVHTTTLPGCYLLCLNVILCACIKLPNTDLSGDFALLADNGKTERIAEV